jgi:hypothetical protein
MHEVTGMSIRDLRDLMGDRRTKYRLSDAQGRPKPEEKAAKEAAAQQAAQQAGQGQSAQEVQQSNDASKSGNYAH